jgi:GT2 family glycosyltransferase
MSIPLVSLITVNLNGREHLEVFFDSVFAQDFPSEQLEVILVDNGSSDDSVPFVRERYPSVRILQNPENLGFAKPNNQAAEVARGTYLALLNNDMKLEPDWVSRMVACRTQASADTVCIASRILNWDGSLVDFIGGTLAFNGMAFQTNFRAPAGSPAARAYPQELLFACGGAMLIDRDAYREAGGFDEDFFAYFEDVDLGWRLWVLGYRIAFCPDATVYHRHNGTSSKFGWHKKLVLFERNSLYALIKNYDDASLGAFLPAALLLAFKRAAVRSGVDRADFAFAPHATPPRPRTARKQGLLLRKATRILHEEGLAVCFKKTVIKLAEGLIRRWNDMPIQPATSGLATIRQDGYATVVGMEDLMDHLPQLLEKRRKIQAARRRPDSEILPLLRTPFEASETQGDYPVLFELVTEQLGVRDHLRRMTEGEARLEASS